MPVEVSNLFYDPRRGDLAFRIGELRPGALETPRRFNGFSILWARSGSGRFHAGLQACPFRAPAFLFANPYQVMALEADGECEGTAIQFHANFFCIETHHGEVGCNGVLFNDHYGSPAVEVPAEAALEFDRWCALMREEFATGGLAQSELLVSYLKVILIRAARCKIEQVGDLGRALPDEARPPVVDRLVELVERRYRERLGPADCARELNISAKALGRLVRRHCGRTLTDLIRERSMHHAKWHLIHTSSPVKEIAADLGYADEFYFSRLFKRSTGSSPTAFREFETAIRSGGNLSMR